MIVNCAYSSKQKIFTGNKMHWWPLIIVFSVGLALKLITADLALIFISYAWQWRNRSLTLSIKIFPNLAWTKRRNEATNFISFSHIPEKFLISSSANVFLSFVAWSLCSCNNWKKICLFFLNKVCHSLWRRPKAGNVSFRGSLWWPVYIINSVDKNQIIF